MTQVARRDISGRATMFMGPSQTEILEEILDWFGDKQKEQASVTFHVITFDEEWEEGAAQGPNATVWYEQL